MSASSSRFATVLGLLALVAWSTSNGLTRGFAAQVGPFTLLAVGFGGGGLLLCALQVLRERSLRAPFQVPLACSVPCGVLLVCYLTGYAGSLALAPDDGVAMVLGLVNYLWPIFVLLFSLVFFPYRARPWILATGLGLGMGGVGLAALPADAAPLDLVEAVWATLRGSPGAFALMAGAAVCWGLYTNVARRLGGDREETGMPALVLAAGGFFLGVRFLVGERSSWEGVSWPALVWFAATVCGASYTLWDVGVRRGDLVLLGSVSLLTPVVATLFSAWWLDQPLTWGLGVGSLLTVAGAALARRGIVAGGGGAERVTSPRRPG